MNDLRGSYASGHSCVIPFFSAGRVTQPHGSNLHIHMHENQTDKGPASISPM
ncbi:hypothetical protein AMATHDRAFT_62734, partial [Amanita thiersii Skay4041]